VAGKDFLLYSGDDESGVEFVLLGGDGVISVTSNVVSAHILLGWNHHVARFHGVHEEELSRQSKLPSMFCHHHQVPALQHEIMAAALKKDKVTAEKLNQPLGLLHKRLFLQANPIPAKWALYRIGKIDSGIRPPLLPLEEEFHAPLDEALVAAGALSK